MSEASNYQEKTVQRRDLRRVDRTRQRVYTGLLLFVVLVGLPIVGVPQLRDRLSTRVQALKTAIKGDVQPAMLQVGASHEPFPMEFERPEPLGPQPPRLPDMDRVFTMNPSRPITPTVQQPTRRAAAAADAESALSQPSVEYSEPGQSAPAAASAGSEISYQKGAAEQDAYNLLLKSNATVAGMVNGSNPTLEFKSWDAASRGDDVYWVRLKFQSKGEPEAEYIWQVKLQSNEVTPLSYNARSIS